MAEFVEKRCEDLIPEFELMERIKLFDKSEVKDMLKKHKEYEYKLGRISKRKEDYLSYIQYEMDLLRLVKLRRDKLNITQKKSNIDYAIANRINRLYKQAIFRFQDDVRFWIAYIKFCKNARFHNCVSRILGRMLQVHHDKPKCWLIAAQWEIEETKDIQSARNFLMKGLHHHPSSTLLFLNMYKLELKEALSKTKSDGKSQEEPGIWRRVEVIYEHACKSIKDIKFVIELLNLTKEYEDTETLQKKIVSDMVKEYVDEPLLWDTLARRELQGLSNPCSGEASAMEDDSQEQNSPRDRIELCNAVYQTAVKKLKTEEMWSLYIDCLLEINQENASLPNLKRKLLKSALSQGHQAKKLKEEYYLLWIGLLKGDKKDENARNKLAQVLCWATEACPNSQKLWESRLGFLLAENDASADEIFTQATELLRNKSLPLWRMKLLHVQAKNPEKAEQLFQTAILGPPSVAKDMKLAYLEWTLLTKNIQEARKLYNSIGMQPPFCGKLHKKMLAIEVMQPNISLQHARASFEMAILQFGKNNTDLWMDYIKFEMKHGDPNKVAEIHSRAVQMLESALSDKFITEYSLLKANPDSIDVIRN